MTKKRILMIVPVSVLALTLGPLVVPFITPWSKINCRQEEINIKTGQARYARYLWFVKVCETVEETALSRALAGASVDAADVEPWQMVNTFSPACTHSPHYKYHGALAQARLLDRMFKRFVPNAKRDGEVAREILRLWQTTGGVNGVCPYFFRVSHADRWTDGKWSLGQAPLSEESPESRYWRRIRERRAAVPKPDRQERYREAVEFHELLSEQGADFDTLREKARARPLSDSERQVFERLCILMGKVRHWGGEAPDPNVAQEDKDAVRAVMAELRQKPSSQPKLKSELGSEDQWDNIEFRFYDGRRCRVALQYFYGDSQRAFSGVTLYLVKHAGKWEPLFWESWIS